MAEIAETAYRPSGRTHEPLRLPIRRRLLEVAELGGRRRNRALAAVAGSHRERIKHAKPGCGQIHLPLGTLRNNGGWGSLQR